MNLNILSIFNLLLNDYQFIELSIIQLITHLKKLIMLAFDNSDILSIIFVSVLIFYLYFNIAILFFIMICISIEGNYQVNY